MTQKIIDAYSYDADGYFDGVTYVQYLTKMKRYNMPDRVTLIKPETPAGHWARFVDGVWTYEKVPTTPAEAIALGEITHYNQTAHQTECVALIQKLCEGSTEYRVRRGTNLEWFVEAIPPKTAEEIQLEELKTRLATVKQNLAETDYVAAKIAEGAATKEEYADVLAQRQIWRKEVNEIEAQISALEA